MPATLNEPPQRCTSYQHDTAAKAMCGSLANSGLPLAVRAPETTQLLLPSPELGSPPLPDDVKLAGPGMYEPRGKMLSSSASASWKARCLKPSPSSRRISSGTTITGKRPVRYQRNSPSIARQSTGDQGSGR